MVNTAQQETEKALAEAAKYAEQAVERGTFSFDQFVENGGVVMPSTTVEIFTDVEANYEIEQLDIRRNQLTKMFKGSIVGIPAEELAPLEAERAKWVERNESSRFVFHLRGIHPSVDIEMREALGERLKNGDLDNTQGAWDDALNAERVARSIVKVVHEAANAEDTGVWTAEKAHKVLKNLPRKEAQKLINVAVYLSVGVTLADRRADAGFPGGGADLAGESQDLSGIEDGPYLDE